MEKFSKNTDEQHLSPKQVTFFFRRNLFLKTFQLHVQLLPTTFHAAPKVFTSNFTMDGWFDQATAGKIKDFMGVGDEASLASESIPVPVFVGPNRCWFRLVQFPQITREKGGIFQKGETIRKNSSLKRMFHSNSPGLWEKEGVWFLLWVPSILSVYNLFHDFVREYGGWIDCYHISFNISQIGGRILGPFLQWFQPSGVLSRHSRWGPY